MVRRLGGRPSVTRRSRWKLSLRLSAHRPRSPSCLAFPFSLFSPSGLSYSPLRPQTASQRKPDNFAHARLEMTRKLPAEYAAGAFLREGDSGQGRHRSDLRRAEVSHAWKRPTGFGGSALLVTLAREVLEVCGDRTTLKQPWTEGRSEDAPCRRPEGRCEG